MPLTICAWSAVTQTYHDLLVVEAVWGPSEREALAFSDWSLLSKQEVPSASGAVRRRSGETLPQAYHSSSCGLWPSSLCEIQLSNCISSEWQGSLTYASRTTLASSTKKIKAALSQDLTLTLLLFELVACRLFFSVEAAQHLILLDCF